MLVEVAAHGEPPQHPGAVDQSGAGGHVTGGAVGPDHEIGPELVAPADGEPVEIGSRPQRAVGPALAGDGSGVERRGPQVGVEHGPGHGPGPARVGQAVEAGQDHPPPGRAHHHHVADVEAGGLGDAEIGQDLKAPRPDEVATGLVPRERGLVQQGHLGAGAGQDQRGDAAGRSGPDHQHVEAPRVHSTPLGR